VGRRQNRNQAKKEKQGSKGNGENQRGEKGDGKKKLKGPKTRVVVRKNGVHEETIRGKGNKGKSKIRANAAHAL